MSQAFLNLQNISFMNLLIFIIKFNIFLAYMFLSIEVPTNVSKKLRLKVLIINYIIIYLLIIDFYKSVNGFEMNRNHNPIYAFGILSQIGKKTNFTNSFVIILF